MDFSRGSSCLRMVNYDLRKIVLGRLLKKISFFTLIYIYLFKAMKGRRMIWKSFERKLCDQRKTTQEFFFFFLK